MGRVAEALARSGQSIYLGAAGDDFAPAASVSTSRVARLGAQLRNNLIDLPESHDEPEELETVSTEGVDRSLTVLLDRESYISEQYRAIRTRLLSHNPANEPWVLGITSSKPKEGKSVTTLNLGLAMSELRHLKVVVVDSDFRHSSLAKMMNIEAAPGFAEAIRGEVELRDVIRPAHRPNLSLIPAGSLGADNPAQLLGSRRTNDILRLLMGSFHYVLIDTPPANAFADVGIIGQLCTGVILVVRMNRTGEPVARRAVRLLQSNNINVLGCILAAMKESGRRGYKYYY